MIRFSAFLVVVAVGLLVAGVVTSKLLLVYIAIGVSGVALLALGIGAAVNWRELTGKPKTAETSAQGPAQVTPEPVPAPPAAPPPPAAPAGAAPAGAGRPATATSIPSGPSRAGYLPAAQPPSGARPPAAPAAFTPRRDAPAPGVWEWRDDSVQTPSAPPRPAEPRPASQTPAPPTSPQPAQKPAPVRAENTRVQDEAKPAAAASKSEPESVPDPEPAPEPKAVGDPEPASEADPALEPELTLVPGIAPLSAAATSQAKHPEQGRQAGQAEPMGPDPSMEVTVVPGVPRYHNARCILIRFMGDSDLDRMTLAAARKAGCTPCRACLPDQPGKSPE